LLIIVITTVNGIYYVKHESFDVSAQVGLASPIRVMISIIEIIFYIRLNVPITMTFTIKIVSEQRNYIVTLRCTTIIGVRVLLKYII